MSEKESARCPVCERDDVRLTLPAQRFVSHDRGFRGRARREQWRSDLCPASGQTESEASLIAKREAHNRKAGAKEVREAPLLCASCARGHRGLARPCGSTGCECFCNRSIVTPSKGTVS